VVVLTSSATIGEVSTRARALRASPFYATGGE
jgi:hypothetical protein